MKIQVYTLEFVKNSITKLEKNLNTRLEFITLLLTRLFTGIEQKNGSRCALRMITRRKDALTRNSPAYIAVH